MKKWLALGFCFLCLPVFPVYAGQLVDLGGYVESITTLSTGHDFDHGQGDHLLQGRVNSSWDFSRTWTGELDFRLRHFQGHGVETNRGLEKKLENDPGYADLSAVLGRSGNEWLIQGQFDRAYVTYSQPDLRVRIGRQRINWSVTTVWNPHDLFNTYTLYDFTYKERPGADALRVEYYTGFASGWELAVRPGGHSDESVVAGLYRGHVGEYDYQLLAGHYRKQVVGGVGWAGRIKEAGFKGEISYFMPEVSGKENSLVGSFGLDYIYPSSLYLHGAYLYNERGTTDSAGGRITATEIAADNLSPARHSLFGELGYEFTPLLNGNFSAVYNPEDHSAYLSPALSWSVWSDFEVTGLAQFYRGKRETQFGELDQLFAVTGRWSY